MKRSFLSSVLAASLLLSAHAEDLSGNFANPPRDAYPMTWWHWMNGNITKEGITADLEAMKKIGLSGAQIFNVAGVPAGPIDYLSPEWLALVKHATEEANRLGLTLSIHNCPGWSSSGGPWNTAENSMKEVVTSELQVTGGTKFDGTLPQPPTKLDFYRDIAVLAFPTQRGSEAPVMMIPAKDEPGSARFEFPKAFHARMISVTPGPKMGLGQLLLESSTDGKTFQRVGSWPVLGEEMKQDFSFAPVDARFFRVSVTSSKPVAVASIELSSRLSVNNFVGKVFTRRGGDYSADKNLSPLPDEVVKKDSVVDLTSRFVEGKLQWNAPAGDWTILRVGYSSTGRINHPTPKGGEGLECDKLSTTAVDAHWDGMMAKVLQDVGPLAGKTLNTVVVDSYEVGTQNWTDDFREQFQKHRGYDLRPYLPILSRRVVDNVEVTERFLWDFRRTIADLFAENYTGHLADLAHKNGLLIAIEPYGDAPSDDLQFAAAADIPMGEFWVDKGVDGCMKLASSTGHVNGRKIIGAESFTAGEKGGNKWELDPAALKGLGDVIYTTGINRFMFHTFTHQPWLNRAPGMTMGACGTHFDRNATWWNEAGSWMQYLARCQWLLQEGSFTADVSYFTGEGVPASMYGETLLKGVPNLPKGYDFDGIDAASLKTAVAKDGRMVLPSGMSYRALVLATGNVLTPPLLKKIKELADGGVIVVGPKPLSSPSLSGYPQCDADVKSLAADLWDTGKITLPPTLPARLKAANLPPDFESSDPSANLSAIHRRVDGADVYFVASPKGKPREVPCTFRVSGKVPELWHADSGKIAQAPVYFERDGRTVVPLRFEPSDSVFVVFRDAPAADHIVSARWSGKEFTDKLTLENGAMELEATTVGRLDLKTSSGHTAQAQIKDIASPIPVDGPWNVTFPPNLGAPASITLPQLMSWTKVADDGVKYFSGAGTYTKKISIPADRFGDGKKLLLDLGEVKNIAVVKLNGRAVGALWKPPFVADVTALARPGENDLEIQVTNLWTNRLIGDEHLPPDCEWAGTGLKQWPQWLLDGKPSPTGRIAFATRRLLTRNDPLLDSGLLGPVAFRSSVTTRISCP